MHTSDLARRASLIGASALLVILAAGCSGDDPPESADAEASQSEASIEDFAFQPQALSISVGSTVTWTNADEAQHTVTSEEEGPLASPDLDEGATYDATFDTPGTYEYFCELHPTMRGTVEVAA